MSLFSRNKIAFGVGLFLFVTLLVGALVSLVYILRYSNSTTDSPADHDEVVHSVVVKEQDGGFVSVIGAIFLFGAVILGLWYLGRNKKLDCFKIHEPSAVLSFKQRSLKDAIEELFEKVDKYDRAGAPKHEFDKYSVDIDGKPSEYSAEAGILSAYKAIQNKFPHRLFLLQKVDDSKASLCWMDEQKLTSFTDEEAKDLTRIIKESIESGPYVFNI